MSISDVLSALSRVPDPRARRGVRHQMTTILAVALCAVLAGARSFVALGEGAANACPQVLSALGVGGCPPCESTLRRTLQRLGGEDLDATMGDWTAGRTSQPGLRRALALDGKTLRGSVGADGWAKHLMAAIDHHAGVVLGQVDVDGKTNEIPMFSQLCDQIPDLEAVVVTADAMHCHKAHADYLLLARGAHYILTVKGNQPTLRNQLKACPGKTFRSAMRFPRFSGVFRAWFDLADQEGRLCWQHRGSTRMSCGNGQWGCTGSHSRGRRFVGWASS